MKIKDAVVKIKEGTQLKSKLDYEFQKHCQSKSLRGSCLDCEYKELPAITCKGAWIEDNPDLELE